MYVRYKFQNASLISEWRLCANCYRMFCLNIHTYIVCTKDDMTFHIHVRCPPLHESIINERK
jgi:hypothetical protein